MAQQFKTENLARWDGLYGVGWDEMGWDGMGKPLAGVRHFTPCGRFYHVGNVQNATVNGMTDV